MSLPHVEALEELLSIAYQASLLKEEERPVTFRLILGEPLDFPEDAGPPSGLQRLVFTEARRLEEHELRRLSPAAKYHRALIGVRLDPKMGFVIGGILQSGARWLRDVQGGRRSQSPVLPSALVINVNGPGRLAL
ncbi:MAG: putative sensor domain DACNV-containing protein, partial [Polyangiaceae bacterium]